MASVVLKQMWLVDVVTETMLTAQTAPDRPQQHGTAGEIRIYAGGRRRAITHPGVQRTWAFALVQLFPADVATLLGWLDSGATILARDHRGQFMYGTFFDADETERTGFPYLYTVAIVMHEVDAPEGV